MERGHVLVVAHHDGIADDRSFSNVGAKANDAMANFSSFDDAPFADDRLMDFCVLDLRAWQVGRPCIDGVCLVVGIEPIFILREHEVGFVIGGDGSNVFPIAVVQERIGIFLFDGGGDEVKAKVIARVAVEQRDEGFSAKDVDAHGGEK